MTDTKLSTTAPESAADRLLAAADAFEEISDAMAEAIQRLGADKAALMRRRAYEIDAPKH